MAIQVVKFSGNLHQEKLLARRYLYRDVPMRIVHRIHLPAQAEGSDDPIPGTVGERNHSLHVLFCSKAAAQKS